jgi:hypothetical protein
MTADNVIGIFTSRAMKERGRFQIQFMKTRSSSGVGQKVDLEFNVETLRITDLDEPEETSLGQQKQSSNNSSIVNSLKRTSVVSTASDSSAPNKFDFSQLERGNTAKTKAPAIRSMLSSLNPEQD